MTPEALNTETTTVKQRIVAFAKSQGISVREFERRCGFRYGYVNSIRQGVSPEKLEAIKTAYPDLSMEWLLCGSGEMTRQPEGQLPEVRQLLAGIERLTETIASQQKTIAILSEQVAEGLKKASF